jgi:hypothetical protein
VTHLRQQGVDPSFDLVDYGFLVSLKSNKAVQRIARETPVAACGANAIQQSRVRPAFHAGRSRPNDLGRFGCAEELHRAFENTDELVDLQSPESAIMGGQGFILARFAPIKRSDHKSSHSGVQGLRSASLR